jgi:ketosteroid isomerase-like protein
MRSPPPPAVLLVLAAAFLAGVAARPTHGVKPKPVRAALERRYAEMVEAYRRRDPATVLGMRRADVFSITPSGDTMRAEAMRGYTEAGFAQVETTLVLEWSLGTIDVHGDTAAAEVDQHWRRRQQKAGALRLVDTRAHQRETWLRESGRWWLWRVDRVVPGEWIVDGKRIDPSRPYDPAAPPFDPR